MASSLTSPADLVLHSELKELCSYVVDEDDEEAGGEAVVKVSEWRERGRGWKAVLTCDRVFEGTEKDRSKRTAHVLLALDG